MRNSKLDSKYFVKSLDYFGIPCQNTQNHPKTVQCNLFTVWFPKELVGGMMWKAHNNKKTLSSNRTEHISFN